MRRVPCDDISWITSHLDPLNNRSSPSGPASARVEKLHGEEAKHERGRVVRGKNALSKVGVELDEIAQAGAHSFKADFVVEVFVCVVDPISSTVKPLQSVLESCLDGLDALQTLGTLWRKGVADFQAAR